MPDIASPANFLVTVSDYWGPLVPACDICQFPAVSRDGIFSLGMARDSLKINCVLVQISAATAHRHAHEFEYHVAPCDMEMTDGTLDPRSWEVNSRSRPCGAKERISRP